MIFVASYCFFTTIYDTNPNTKKEQQCKIMKRAAPPKASVSFDNICLELPSGQKILEGRETGANLVIQLHLLLKKYLV